MVQIPRRKPDRVQEVRVTLGTKERQQLDRYILMSSIDDFAKGVGIIGIGAALGLGAYAAYNWTRYMTDLLPPLGEVLSEMAMPFTSPFGKYEGERFDANGEPIKKPKWNEPPPFTTGNI